MRSITIAVVLVAGTLIAGLGYASPAFAEGQNEPRFERRGSWQERSRENEHWRYKHRSNGYYSAPPIIYAPPQYYQQPGASLNFSFPLFR